MIRIFLYKITIKYDNAEIHVNWISYKQMPKTYNLYT